MIHASPTSTFQLSIENVQQLYTKGYCVIDNFTSEETCNRLYGQIRRMYQDNELEKEYSTSEDELIDNRPFHTRIVSIDGGDNGDIPQETVQFVRETSTVISTQVNEAFNREIAEKKLPWLPYSVIGKHKPLDLHSDYCYTKLACCSSNGAFLPPHLDNHGSDDRKLTCILYVNPEWNTCENSGQLRIHMFDHMFPMETNEPSEKPRYVDVDPKFNRLVLFWSDVMVHQVLPVQLPPDSSIMRCTVTIWLSVKSSRYHVQHDRYLINKIMHNTWPSN